VRERLLARTASRSTRRVADVDDRLDWPAPGTTAGAEFEGVVYWLAPDA